MITNAARSEAFRERISAGCFLEKCTIVHGNSLQDKLLNRSGDAVLVVGSGHGLGRGADDI